MSVYSFSLTQGESLRHKIGSAGDANAIATWTLVDNVFEVTSAVSPRENIIESVIKINLVTIETDTFTYKKFKFV